MDSPINKSTNNLTEPSQLIHDIPSQTHNHDNTEEDKQTPEFCQDVAVVKEIQMGTGELQCKKMKCLICVLKSGMEFKIGVGFTEYDQLNPPKIGETITFCCADLVNGKPRFPRFIPPSKIQEVQIKNEDKQKEADEGDISKLTQKLEDLSLVK